MKKLVMSFALLAMLALGACNKGDDGGGGGDSGNTTDAYASTPQPCNGTTGACQTPTNQQWSNWCGYRANNGAWIPTSTCSYNGWQFPQTYNPTAGSCGCPAGYMAVYGGYGYACAPSANYTGYQFFYVGYNFNGFYRGYPYWNYGQNYRWLNNWQGNYSSNYSQQNYNNCGTQIAQGCDVRLNNCPSGSRCQPAGGGSTIGLCVR